MYEAGYALFAPEIYIGPKVVVLGDQNFDQYRAGGFISGFRSIRIPGEPRQRSRRIDLQTDAKCLLYAVWAGS